ncbi:Serine/threonine-protein phosphatase PP2A catalytic subunit [Tritrichomonas foetus]|uniref:Serine/threonine-protein phosphatase n=1 Tax=Tritrichomonas foetus TaxID=1144522 RepID=A0A1J4J7M4_9EUKA|nr:Serine/threonine-protein phosphatase PP2A catalytic subunit [Tritrichomonas foetus]|eukprot:OHS93437.1 Serine/threonine-protein phosphatase PP2A catalytic subunit [Tritrichomonas foetus]
MKFKNTLIKVRPPVYIVGDIHGSLLDLLRILKYGGSEPSTRYLFLGDYVDRGSLSTEVITLLVALFCDNPESFTLLRGNHEFRETSGTYGFKDEVVSTYGDSYVWEEFSRLFEYLPIAGILGKDIFCVHGGVSPELFNLTQIENIQRPFENEYPKFVSHLLWGDPSSEFADFSESSRGKGVTFGKTAASQFFAYTGVKKIIRAHQCVEGVEPSLDGACLTVFSTSNYKPKKGNSSGILKVSKNLEMENVIFPPIPKLNREEYIFNTFSENNIIKRPLSLQTSPSNFIFQSKNIGTSFLTAPTPKAKISSSCDSKARRTESIKSIIHPNKNDSKSNV